MRRWVAEVDGHRVSTVRREHRSELLVDQRERLVPANRLQLFELAVDLVEAIVETLVVPHGAFHAHATSRARRSRSRPTLEAVASEGRRTKLAEQRKSLPKGPGVYVFRDAKGKVIYVGKAKNLRSRVGGHFTNPVTRGAYEMVDSIESVEFLLVSSETEALLTE